MGVPILEEILTAIQNVITWFVNILPPWAKILLSLFFVMFLAGWFVPIMLGFSYGCTSDGSIYRMGNAFTGWQVINERLFTDIQDISNSNSTIDYTDIINRTDDQKNFADWVIRFLPCYVGSNSTNCQLGAFDYFKYQNPSNYTLITIESYNALVMSGGSYQYHVTEGRDVFTPKCEGVTPKLFLFNKIDMFDPTLWLIITIISFLIPLAFKWYQITGIY